MLRSCWILRRAWIHATSRSKWTLDKKRIFAMRTSAAGAGVAAAVAPAPAAPGVELGEAASLDLIASNVC